MGIFSTKIVYFDKDQPRGPLPSAFWTKVDYFLARMPLKCFLQVSLLKSWDKQNPPLNSFCCLWLVFFSLWIKMKFKKLYLFLILVVLKAQISPCRAVMRLLGPCDLLNCQRGCDSIWSLAGACRFRVLWGRGDFAATTAVLSKLRATSPYGSHLSFLLFPL